jgi:hypothetical protein
MAATVRKFQDLIEGTTTTDPLLIGGVTLNSAALADLIAIADPNFIAITLDPEKEDGAPEIIWVTAHTGASTSATILRAQEGTTAREHLSGTKFVVALTADAVEGLEAQTAAALAAANEADDTADAAMVVADAAQTSAEVATAITTALDGFARCAADFDSNVEVTGGTFVTLMTENVAIPDAWTSVTVSVYVSYHVEEIASGASLRVQVEGVTASPASYAPSTVPDYESFAATRVVSSPDSSLAVTLQGACSGGTLELHNVTVMVIADGS